mmetsp:Transcript_39737/g.60904  ORF Transcript_39737/g.60904 Transcript_39737/m.60904 type:complete len:320 (+) Transcript_39737:2519-3478(+)
MLGHLASYFLAALEELDALHHTLVGQEHHSHHSIERLYVLGLQPLFKVTAFGCLLVHHGSEAVLLNTDLLTIFLAKDLGAICVLAVEAAVLVANEDHLVFANLGGDTSLGIGLVQAVDLTKVFVDPVLEFTAESFVVGHHPPHLLSLELGDVTIRPQDFSVLVVEMADDDASEHVHAIDLRVRLGIGEAGVTDLNDVSVVHVADHQAVLQGSGGARSSGSLSQVLILEQAIEEVRRAFFPDRLGLLFLLDFSLGVFLGVFLLLISSSLLSFFFGSDLLRSGFRRLDLNHLLRVAVRLQGFYHELGLVIGEVEPELVITD